MEAVRTLAAQVRASRLPSSRDRRRIREAAGVSVRDAAQALGVDPMTILRWERGETSPSRARAAAYRELLDALEEALQ